MASTLAKIKDAVGEKVEEIKEMIKDERKVGDMEHRKHELAANPALLATDRLLRLRIVSANFTKLDDYQHCFAVVTVGRNVARTAPRPLIDPKFADYLTNSPGSLDYVRRQNLKKGVEQFVPNVSLNDPSNTSQMTSGTTETPTTLPGDTTQSVVYQRDTVTATHHPTAIEQATATTTVPASVAAAALAAPANPNPPPLQEGYAPVIAPHPQSHSAPMGVPKSGISEKEVNWEEHFSIEHTKAAEEEKIHIEVFAKTIGKDIFLGEYKMKIGDVVAPKKRTDVNLETNDKSSSSSTSSKDTSNWSLISPQEYPLTDKKDIKVGTICLLLRRETKLYGSLRVNVKEVYLEQANENVHQAKCIMKLVNEVQETSVASGTHDRTTSHFKWNATSPKTFDINTHNHVFDLFIELWNADPMRTTVGEVTPLHDTCDAEGNTEEINRGDKKVLVNPLLIGQARLTIYDTRGHIKEPIPMFTFDNRHVGYIVVDAELTEDAVKEDLADREKKQAMKILDAKRKEERKNKEHPNQADVELAEAKSKAVKGGGVEV